MPIDLDSNQLNLLGSKFDAIGYVIAAEVAEMQNNNDDALKIAELTVLSTLLILIGDTLLLFAISKSNEQGDESEENNKDDNNKESGEDNNDDTNKESIDGENNVEEGNKNLENLALWLNVIADSIAFQLSLVALNEINNKDGP